MNGGIKMSRFILAVKIRSGIYIILAFLCFTILLPILIVGIGTDAGLVDGIVNKAKIPGFYIKPNEIAFDNTNGGGPKIKVYFTKENRIKEVYLEEYVRGVVAAEMPAEFGVEALKAQAIAARTYAVSNMEQYNGTKCNQANGGDICDTVHCQAYVEKDERFEGWPESKRGVYWNKITDAVKETLGQVLIYNGQVAIDVSYFSTSSGKTEDAAEVFSSNTPYLKSVKSPGEESSPKYKSIQSFSYNEAADKLNKTFPNSKVSASRLRSQITILSPRSSGGSVKQVKLGNITITGSQFRSALGLNSSNFELKFNKDNISITTYGYGHGVGMSQWGANAMSKEGKKYDEILKHYYQGVSIEKLYK
jgi:stage II sporulation protein D